MDAAIIWAERIDAAIMWVIGVDIDTATIRTISVDTNIAIVWIGINLAAV